MLTFLGSMTAYTITATGDSPSPRLGHACILVGNAFIRTFIFVLHRVDA